ncbi:MAG: hypothetical protein KAS32_02455 [Candidatus Peribacteraceae bacterium]|nr:hypothetical protein [Candidatus Peribacteraceae bacterium]
MRIKHTSTAYFCDKCGLEKPLVPKKVYRFTNDDCIVVEVKAKMVKAFGREAPADLCRECFVEAVKDIVKVEEV